LHFVGGHPIAGREGKGFVASSAALFRGHAWVLSPSADAAALRVVRRMVRATGARPCLLDAATHDRTLAFLSHVPQLVSWALLEAALGDPAARRGLGLAGPGFRDMTRLARSPRPLWREILGQNRGEVVRALRALERALARSRRNLLR
jgi:prephenate dehydrogenase